MPGFAILKQSLSSLLGPVFGSKDNFLGLGVFVDTYPNEEKQHEVSEETTAPCCPPAACMGRAEVMALHWHAVTFPELCSQRAPITAV